MSTADLIRAIVGITLIVAVLIWKARHEVRMGRPWHPFYREDDFP